MIKTVALCLLSVAFFQSCSEKLETSPNGPIAKLRQWHKAFLAGDAARARPLLSIKSRKYMSSLPEKAGAGSEPLQVLSMHRDGSRVDIEVRDPSPNAAVAKGVFVMVKEEGEWRLDLIKTAGANSHEVAQPGPPMRLRRMRLSKRQAEDLRRRAVALDRQRRWAEANARRARRSQEPKKRPSPIR